MSLRLMPLSFRPRPHGLALGRVVGDTRPRLVPRVVAPSLQPKKPFMKVEVQESAEEYALRVELPGLDHSDVQLSLQPDRTLSIGASESRTREETDASGTVVRRERSSSTQHRMFRLPRDVDEKSISASMDKGVLSIALPRRALEQKPAVQQIAIRGPREQDAQKEPVAEAATPAQETEKDDAEHLGKDGGAKEDPWFSN